MGPERVFRYAPLSSGLEIVRKTLGQHEVATQVHRPPRSIRAPASSISPPSWPMPPGNGSLRTGRSAPSARRQPRIGWALAALTYARRYALFTLVGIAGEDDLDAPDLMTPVVATSERSTRRAGDKAARHGNGSGATKLPTARHAKAMPARERHTLDPQQSALRRDLLLSGLPALHSADAAAAWAQRVMETKNSLTAADAKRVEEAFQALLANLARHDMHETPLPSEPKRPKRIRTKSIDKSVLAFPEPRRIRDRDHVRFVAQQPCLICGRKPCDAHHLRFTQNQALGRKASDEFTVPLCRGHHREVHRCGDEAALWQKTGIDPVGAARVLWLKTHQSRLVQAKWRANPAPSLTETTSRMKPRPADQPAQRAPASSHRDYDVQSNVEREPAVSRPIRELLLRSRSVMPC